MRYETAAAFRMALEDRLRRSARDPHTTLTFLRKRVVFERFLARLAEAAPDRWILKGALSLDFRIGHGSRTTLDMDLAPYDNEQRSTDDMLTAASLDLGDFLVYGIELVGRRGDDLGASVRYRLAVELAGRPFDTVLVDIGFSDPLLWQPDRSTTPGSLEFAGIPAISVPILPLEQQVAEKLHAYAKTYAGERRSSRVKDLVDLNLIVIRFSLDAERLDRAIRAVFEHRPAQVVPGSLPEPPAGWEAPFSRMQEQMGRGEGIEPAYRRVAQLPGSDPGRAYERQLGSGQRQMGYGVRLDEGWHS